MPALAESINVREESVVSMGTGGRDSARCDWGPNSSGFLVRWNPVPTCLSYEVKMVLNPFAAAEDEWIKGDQQDELFEALVS